MGQVMLRNVHYQLMAKPPEEAKSASQRVGRSRVSLFWTGCHALLTS